MEIDLRILSVPGIDEKKLNYEIEVLYVTCSDSDLVRAI